MCASAPASGSIAAPQLIARELRCRRGDRILFSGISFRLGAGEILQIEGANGSGKTTLLRAICGLAPAEEGRILWNDHDVGDADSDFFAATAYVGHAAGMKLDLTPRENLETALAIAGGEGVNRWRGALERIGLLAVADVPLRRLSAGQVRRVSLARLLMRSCSLWMLDEPFSALDRAGKSLLEALIVEHCAGGGMVLLTTHQPADLGSVPVHTLNLGH